jgi:hypothetical protein
LVLNNPITHNRKVEENMAKVIFELMDYKENPNGKEKLSIEIKMEPLKQNGKARELADLIIDVIDEFRKTGAVYKLDAHRY